MIERMADGTLRYTPSLIEVGICRDCGADVPIQQFYATQKCARCAPLAQPFPDREEKR